MLRTGAKTRWLWGGAALVGCVAVVVLVVVLVLDSGSGTNTPRVESRLASVAIEYSTRDGDATPAVVQYTQGTRGALVQAAQGAGIPADQGGAAASYLVVVNGHFTVKNAGVRPGSPIPHGAVMTLVVSRATGKVTDFGVGPSTSGLSQLRKLMPLPARIVRAAELKLAQQTHH